MFVIEKVGTYVNQNDHHILVKSLRAVLRMTYCFCKRAILPVVILTLKEKKKRKEKGILLCGFPKMQPGNLKSQSSKASPFETSFISTIHRFARH